MLTKFAKFFVSSKSHQYICSKPSTLNKLDLIIQEKQAELRGLQAELQEALIGIELPDYEVAARIQPLIYGVQKEISWLEKLRDVSAPPAGFATHLSRLLTDDSLTTLELWTQIKDYWHDSTFPLLTIRKPKANYYPSCTIRLTEAAEGHLFGEHTVAELRHLGWNPARGDKIFYYKARVKNPDQFDAFCQKISVTLLEVLPSLFGLGRQYFCFG
jgi:hypothetical protein